MVMWWKMSKSVSQQVLYSVYGNASAVKHRRRFRSEREADLRLEGHQTDAARDKERGHPAATIDLFVQEEFRCERVGDEGQ